MNVVSAQATHSLAPALRRVFLGALAVLAAATLTLAALRTSASSAVLAYTEGVVFVSAERLAEGGIAALYPPHPELTRPYLLTPYFPLFYLEWAGVRSLLGLPDSMVPGRLVALCALLACTVLLWRLAARTLREGTDARWIAAASALVWLASPAVVEWGGLATTDLAALAASFFGVYLVGHRWAADAPTWPAMIAFAAALLTKQSCAAGLAAASLFLLLERRRLPAAVLFGGSTALVLAAGTLLERHTAGGFTAATIGALRQPLLWEQFGHTLESGLFAPLIWLLLALSLPALAAAWRGSGWVRLAALYAATTIGLALATLGKAGSDTNYFIEPTLALCWTAALGVERLTRLAHPLRGAAAAGLLALGAGANVDDLAHEAKTLARERLLVERAGRQLRAEHLKGWVLSPTTLYPLVERLGARVYVNDSYLYALFWEAGEWPRGGFLSDLSCGRVRAILGGSFAMDRPREASWGLGWKGWSFWNSPLWVPLIHARYELTAGREEDAVFVYHPRSSTRCPRMGAPSPTGSGGPSRPMPGQPISPASRKEK